MRAVNEKRTIIEFVRVNRVIESKASLFDDDKPFIDDLHERMVEGKRLTASWRNHDWHLGNVKLEQDKSGQPVVTGQFGFSEDAPADAPVWDTETGDWVAESPLAPSGALAYFAVSGSQVMAVTCLKGELSMDAFCRALSNLLNQSEMSAAHNEMRTKRLWELDVITRAGSYRAWSESVVKITQIEARFHLPNPRVSDDIAPIVEILEQAVGERGTISLEGEEGLQIENVPLVAAAVAMHEHEYGSVKACGVKADGTIDPFISEKHAVRETVKHENSDDLPSMGEIAGMVLRKLANYVEKRGGGH